jgi:hypothetical protein
MAYFLIDFENIRNIQGVSSLTQNDTVIFFYTKNSNDLSFSLHREIGSSPAKFEYFEGQNGSPNALDFQLSSYLGFLIAQFPNEAFYIVSKDKGFEHLISFWSTEKLPCSKIERIENIALKNKVIAPKEATAKSPTKAPVGSLRDELRKNVDDLQIKETDISKIITIIEQYKTKQAINNNLMKFFKSSEKVGKITKVLRPFLKSKK